MWVLTKVKEGRGEAHSSLYISVIMIIIWIMIIIYNKSIRLCFFGFQTWRADTQAQGKSHLINKINVINVFCEAYPLPEVLVDWIIH